MNRPPRCVRAEYSIPIELFGRTALHDYGSLNNPKRVEGWKATVASWLGSRGLPDLPVVVSEYGAYGGSDGTSDFRADRMVQAANMAAMGRYYVLGRMDMPMHWVFNHLSNDRKDIHVDCAGAALTPYGMVVRMQSMLKSTRVSATTSPGANANGIGVAALATLDASGLAVLYYNYQAQSGTTSSSTDMRIVNLPDSLAGGPIRVRHYLMDTGHNNRDYNSSVTSLQPVSDEIRAGAPSFVLNSTLAPNAVSLLRLEPAS